MTDVEERAKYLRLKLGLNKEQVLWVNECGSTMELAREHLTAYPKSVALVVAEEQQSGRGRQGRAWSSVPGAFQGTFIYPLTKEPNPAATLAVGLAVSLALEQGGVQIRLKWPNDLISHTGRKLGGILTEYIANPVLT